MSVTCELKEKKIAESMNFLYFFNSYVTQLDIDCKFWYRFWNFQTCY